MEIIKNNSVIFVKARLKKEREKLKNNPRHL